MLAASFWIALLLLAYVYAGYPILIAALARLRPRSIRKAPIRPSVTIVVIAHNEDSLIARRLENCLTVRYPRDRFTVVLASDGSTDGTVAEGRRFESQGVRIIDFPRRRGKPSVLNDVLPACSGDIVILADARQTFERDAVTALVDNFADPAVGAASGELVLGPGATAVGHGVGFYWRYEKFIRRHESRFDSTVGVTGAVYAIRRALFEPIPSDTLLDDVSLPLSIARRGYRVIFEPRAIAFDMPSVTSRQEFTRKLRTIAGTIQLLIRERWLWTPRENRLWFQTLSHKALRLASPFLLLVLLSASMALSGTGSHYRLALLGQLGFYAAAGAGALLSQSRLRMLAVPYAFVLLNVTTAAGVFAYFAGHQRVTWRKLSSAESRSQPDADDASTVCSSSRPT